MRRIFRLLTALLLIVTRSPANAEAQALLQISSPTTGSVVNPGQTLTVEVSSPAKVPFVNVGVLAESPIGMATTLQPGVPAQFTLNIPADITCRKYIVTADGTTASGQHVSTSVTINVEPPDMPASLRPNLPMIGFEAPGVHFPIKVLGSFRDGRVLDVTNASHVTYASSNPAVATVSRSGEVTAISAGDAIATVSYGPPAQQVFTKIPVNVPAPVFLIEPAQLDFGAQRVGTASSLQVTLTNATLGSLGIVGITTTGDYSATSTCVSASPMAANAMCTITVTFAPTAAGSRVGWVRIANSFTILPVAFRVIGTGATP